MKITGWVLILFLAVNNLSSCVGNSSQTNGSKPSPDWQRIKANAAFTVHGDDYEEPYLQPLNVGGWEDGLFITRDGLTLYSTYLPVDVFSLYAEWVKNPVCFNYEPYYRPPRLDVDMTTNPWGCETFFQTDIVVSKRADTLSPFPAWSPSKMKRSVSNEGAVSGVLRDESTFDAFVFTQNRKDTETMEILFAKDVSINPEVSEAVVILRADPNEDIPHDNPHLERLPGGSLLIFFDRGRSVHYSLSQDDGDTWSEPVKITRVLNDHAPYDTQPHLWHDGNDWWVYFCQDNKNGVRSIYRSRQRVAGNWDSWAEPEIVIEPKEIVGGYGTIAGVGEPSLTAKGDISFVVIYGDPRSEDKTDVFDCDPWFLPRKARPEW